MENAARYSFFDVESSFRAANEIPHTLPKILKPADEDQ